MTTASPAREGGAAHVAADEVGAVAERARGRGAMSRGISSMPVTRAPAGAAAQPRGQRRCARPAPAARAAGWRAALAAADVEHARAGRDQAVLERGGGTPGRRRSLPRAKCQANRPARAVRRAGGVDQARARPRGWRVDGIAASCGAGAASRRGAGSASAGSRGRRPARATRCSSARQHLEHDRLGRSACARRCRRAAAGCRRPPSPSRQPREHARRVARARCRSRAASSSPAAGRGAAAPAPAAGCAGRPARGRSAAPRR